MHKFLRIKVLGRVQGVFFRDEAQKQAENLSIAGFAQNQADGSVYVEAEGEEADLQKLVEWCQKGPRWAKVDKVMVDEGAVKNFSDFRIKY